jgi:hypothetical protein
MRFLAIAIYGFGNDLAAKPARYGTGCCTEDRAHRSGYRANRSTCGNGSGNGPDALGDLVIRFVVLRTLA